MTLVCGGHWCARSTRARRARNAALGGRLEYWPVDRLRQALATDRYHGALFDPDAFTFHALNFTRGIADAALANGGRLFEDSPVLSVNRQGDRHAVRTARGRVLADHVVYCCSGYLGWLHPRLAWSTIPVGAYVMVTALGRPVGSAIRVPVSPTTASPRIVPRARMARILWGGYVGAVTSAPSRGQDAHRHGPRLSATGRCADRRRLAWHDGLRDTENAQIGRQRRSLV